MEARKLYHIASAGYAALFIAFVLCCIYISGDARDLILYGFPTLILLFTIVLAYLYMYKIEHVKAETKEEAETGEDGWEKPPTV